VAPGPRYVYEAFDDCLPRIGDQILGFKNDYESGVLNGEVWTIEGVNSVKPTGFFL
jgi:hypothetical protein